MSTNQQFIASKIANNPGILIPDRPIAFNRDYVHLGVGIKGALFLSQAMYWTKRTKDEGGWFYKTIEDWETETGLTEEEQRSIKNTLVSKGYLVVEKRGLPARNHFKVETDNIAADLIEKAVLQSREDNGTSGGNSTGHSISENTTEIACAPILIVRDEIKPKTPNHTTQVYKRLIKWAEDEREFPFMSGSITKQYAAFKEAGQNKLKPSELQDRWKEMAQEPFWSEKGFDWMDVVKSFNKRPA